MPSSPSNPQPLHLHLVLPFAQTGGDPHEAPALAAWPEALPQLQALLAEASTRHWHRGTLDGRTPPHEWALALAQGRLNSLPATLPDATTLPWAAWDAQAHHAALLPTPDAAAAWFMPAHQEVGMDHVSLHPPEALRLDDATSQQLMQALAPLAAEDGMALHWVSASRWLAVGEVFRTVAVASPDRVTSPSGERSIAPWMADLPPSLRRLQTEAQMLFYTHPAHDQRSQQGLPPVNSVWIAGAGAASAAPAPQPDRVTVVHGLRQAALAGDAAAWTRAWLDTDAQVLPAWLARARAGEPLTVSLCGERSLLRLGFGPRSLGERWGSKISNIFKPQRLNDIQSLL
jgi:hypothetical protein